jgi:hypothetical protein
MAAPVSEIMDGSLFVKMYLGEAGWCGMDWIYMAQDRD